MNLNVTTVRAISNDDEATVKLYKTKCAACHKATAEKFYDPEMPMEEQVEAILKYILFGDTSLYPCARALHARYAMTLVLEPDLAPLSHDTTPWRAWRRTGSCKNNAGIAEPGLHVVSSGWNRSGTCGRRTRGAANQNQLGPVLKNHLRHPARLC